MECKTAKMRFDEDNKKTSIIDKYIFFLSLILIVGLTLPVLFLGKEGQLIIINFANYLTENLGFLNILVGLFAIFTCIYLCFSKYGDIVLGNNEKPEYNSFSWGTMMFCAGIGSSVMYWGVLEWISYYIAPPFAMEAMSSHAAEYAATYGMFHWGPIGWALYVLPSIPIAYCMFIKKENNIKISNALRPILKYKSDSIVGKSVDALFIFASVGACSTSLGLCVPMVTTGISKIFNIEVSNNTKILVLAIIVIIFTISSCFGLKKGIQILSNLNVSVVLGILIFVLITGPTVFIIKMGITSFGIMGQNFLRMSTWLDPINNSGFPESWTVFYWGWWIISSPIIGMFIAKISKGRTIRQVISGALIYGSIGCALVFIILGNYGLYLQVSGTFDVVGYLSEFGPHETIFKILGMLKLGKIITILFTFGAMIFAATTFDSISYIIASCTTKLLEYEKEPSIANRLFWALLLAFIPSVFILTDGPMEVIQSTSIITVVPGIVVFLLLSLSLFKMLKEDKSI